MFYDAVSVKHGRNYQRQDKIRLKRRVFWYLRVRSIRGLEVINISLSLMLSLSTIQNLGFALPSLYTSRLLSLPSSHQACKHLSLVFCTQDLVLS